MGRGIDLAAEWRSRRWRRLLNLIDRLPRASQFVEALADDDELAEQALAAGDPPPAQLRMSEWDTSHAALARVYDRLADVIRATVAAAGAKPPDLDPYPRPVTAADRVRERKSRERHLALVQQVLPDAAAGGDVSA